jgi:hypothetical protein
VGNVAGSMLHKVESKRQLHNGLHSWPTCVLTEKRRRVRCGGKPIETLTLLDAFATTLIPKDMSNFFDLYLIYTD